MMHVELLFKILYRSIGHKFFPHDSMRRIVNDEQSFNHLYMDLPLFLHI